MNDPSETAALKASFRGAMSTAEALHALQDKIEALEPRAEISAEALEELARITAAHAVASAALRGLVEMMRARRA